MEKLLLSNKHLLFPLTISDWFGLLHFFSFLLMLFCSCYCFVFNYHRHHPIGYRNCTFLWKHTHTVKFAKPLFSHYILLVVKYINHSKNWLVLPHLSILCNTFQPLFCCLICNHIEQNVNESKQILLQKIFIGTIGV